MQCPVHYSFAIGVMSVPLVNENVVLSTYALLRAVVIIRLGAKEDAKIVITMMDYG